MACYANASYEATQTLTGLCGHATTVDTAAAFRQLLPGGVTKVGHEGRTFSEKSSLVCAGISCPDDSSDPLSAWARECGFEYAADATSPTSSTSSASSTKVPTTCGAEQMSPVHVKPANFSLLDPASKSADDFSELLSPRSWNVPTTIDAGLPIHAPQRQGVTPVSSSNDLVAIEMAHESIRRTLLSASNEALSVSGRTSKSAGRADLVDALLDLASTLSTSTPSPGYKKAWWETLEVLLIMPDNCRHSVKKVIKQAKQAAEMEGANPTIAKLLKEALDCRHSVNAAAEMQHLAVKVYKHFKPADLEDNLRSVIKLPLAPATHNVAPLRTVGPTTRSPQGASCPKAMQGDSNFQEHVKTKSSRPWFELVEEVRFMKPNNGYPVRCNIVAAIHSASNHPVYRSNEVVHRLKQSLAPYCRKSCGATKQLAIKVLDLKKSM